MKRQKTKLDQYPVCDADKELASLIRAKYSLIYVVTWEEKRLIQSLSRICEEDDVAINGIHVWDIASGLKTHKGQPIPDLDEGVITIEDILSYICTKAEEEKGKIKEFRGPVYVLHDVFRFLENRNLEPIVERRLRSLSWLLESTSLQIVMTSPVLELPTSLQKCITVIDYPLPNRAQLTVLTENSAVEIESAKMSTKEKLCDPKTEKVVDALLGLTLHEATDALAKAFVDTGKFDTNIISGIKKDIVRKGQLLEFISEKESMDVVGGFSGLKEFIRIRKAAFSEDARSYGLPAPKGIFMLGIQGSGKSLSAMAVASELDVPLLKMDVGRLFSSWVGESERNLRQALLLAESVAPCVLLVDEIDKMLSGSTGSVGDSGTTRRVIGSLLGWMQSRKAPVFVVACANSLASLPPEILRKGRFDELFFVDLPTLDERSEILAIHVRKRGRNPKSFDLATVAKGTENFSGAELENVVIEAMHLGFDDCKREFTSEDMMLAVHNCKPLANVDVMRDTISQLREESRGRMRKASESLYSRTENELESISKFARLPKGKQNENENK